MAISINNKKTGQNSTFIYYKDPQKTKTTTTKELIKHICEKPKVNIILSVESLISL